MKKVDCPLLRDQVSRAQQAYPSTTRLPRGNFEHFFNLEKNVVGRHSNNCIANIAVLDAIWPCLVIFEKFSKLSKTNKQPGISALLCVDFYRQRQLARPFMGMRCPTLSVSQRSLVVVKVQFDLIFPKTLWCSQSNN